MRWPDGALRPALAALTLAAALVLAGCAQNRTELIVGVLSDLPARGTIDHVELLVEQADNLGVPLVSQGWDLTNVPGGQFVLPGSFGVYTSDGTETRVHISAAAISGGFPGGKTVVARDALVSLVHGKTLFLRLALIDSCRPSAVSCVAGQTCVDGKCASKNVNAAALPAYLPGMESTVQCGSGTTYINSATHAALPAGAGCAAGQMCVEGTCVQDSYFMSLAPSRAARDRLAFVQRLAVRKEG